MGDGGNVTLFYRFDILADRLSIGLDMPFRIPHWIGHKSIVKVAF